MDAWLEQVSVEVARLDAHPALASGRAMLVDGLQVRVI